jgi:hypothetical protein
MMYRRLQGSIMQKHTCNNRSMIFHLCICKFVLHTVMWISVHWCELNVMWYSGNHKVIIKSLCHKQTVNRFQGNMPDIGNTDSFIVNVCHMIYRTQTHVYHTWEAWNGDESLDLVHQPNICIKVKYRQLRYSDFFAKYVRFRVTFTLNRLYKDVDANWNNLTELSYLSVNNP